MNGFADVAATGPLIAAAGWPYSPAGQLLRPLHAAVVAGYLSYVTD